MKAYQMEVSNFERALGHRRSVSPAVWAELMRTRRTGSVDRADGDLWKGSVRLTKKFDIQIDLKKDSLTM